MTKLHRQIIIIIIIVILAFAVGYLGTMAITQVQDSQSIVATHEAQAFETLEAIGADNE